MSTNRKLTSYLLCFALFPMMISCGSDKPQGKEISPSGQRGGEIAPGESRSARDASAYALRIIPQKAYKGSTLSLIAEGFSLADARIVWKLNGVPVPGQASASYKAEEASRGDMVQAAAVVHDQQIVSNDVTIANTAPEFTKVRILPENFNPGDTFFVEVSVSDADGDDVVVSYEWILNGATVSTGKAIGVPVKRGDQLTIKLIASDGKENSLPAVLKREVRNFPPVISDETSLRCDSQICSGRIIASDPDGDQLSYMLKQGPPHMTVDPVSGLVEWQIPAAFIGKEMISVAVSDRHGGESVKAVSIDVRK